MIHLVYPLGKQKWKHNELRYSLRSVHDYVGGPDKVEITLLGDPPEWLHGVRVVRTERQKPHSVNGDQIHKLRVCLLDSQVPERFIWMNKDFMLMDWPKWDHYYHRDPAPKRLSFHGTAFENTVKLLNDLGIEDVLDFEVHMPMLLEKSNLAAMLYHLSHGKLCFRTVYGNMFNVASSGVRDVKLSRGQLPPTDWWCFSTDDTIARDPVQRDFLSIRYHRVSPWEQDRKT